MASSSSNTDGANASSAAEIAHSNAEKIAGAVAAAVRESLSSVLSPGGVDQGQGIN